MQEKPPAMHVGQLDSNCNKHKSEKVADRTKSLHTKKKIKNRYIHTDRLVRCQLRRAI